MTKNAQHYMLIAIACGLVSIGVAFNLKTAVHSAELTQSSSSSLITAPVATTVPTAAPAPTPTPTPTQPAPCSYSYGEWSICSSAGKQTRVVKDKSPSGCVMTTAPVLERSCVFTAPAAANNTPCSYTFSNWSACNSASKQTRVILFKGPASCVEAERPALERSCDASTEAINLNTQAKVSIENEGTATPDFRFINLTDGAIIEGSFEIESSVASALNVEFYISPAESNIPRYFGSARKTAENRWSITLDSSKQPNGAFYIVTKVKNAYGTYEGGKRKIIIANKSASEEIIATEKSASISASEKTGVVPAKSENGISSEWRNKYFGQTECPSENDCAEERDPDNDGLSNADEYRYKTDPKKPDTDQDGFLDGDEIRNGFNPLQASPGDKSDRMVFESPKDSGEIKKDVYRVEQVALVQATAGGRNLEIRGKALPNTFVTIYIYSDPIILTVKTDADGNWSYVLDKQLEDGEHQAYVAVTDNTGKITAKSEPIAFVKTAEAVTIVPPAEAAAVERAASPTKLWSRNDLFFFIAIGLGALALAFASLGLIKHNMYKKSQENNLN